jgi:hypothetical protein
MSLRLRITARLPRDLVIGRFLGFGALLNWIVELGAK